MDNSRLAAFPPIRDQGPLNTCVPFAVVYYAFSHEVNLREGRDGALPEHQFSPKWAYNLMVPGSDTGSFTTEAVALLQRHGAATVQAMPYDLNFRAWPIDGAIWESALDFKALGTNYFFGVDQPADREVLKAWLAAGHVAVVETFITRWVVKSLSNDPSTTGDDAEAGKAVVSSVSAADAAFHVMAVVGYDDRLWLDQNANGIVDPGERGAFRLANSYGTSWRDQGFVWFSYDALHPTSAFPGQPARIQGWKGVLGPTAYGLTLQARSPQLLARVRVRHAQRSQLTLRLGSSTTAETAPTREVQRTVPNANGGAYAFDGTTTPVTATFVFDLTDIATAGASTRWYLTVVDAPAAQDAEVFEFELVDRTRGNAVTRLMTGLPAAVSGTTQVFRIDYAF